MPSFSSREVLSVLLLGVVAAAHAKWRALISTVLPDPYLDEVFHIPQAQAYWDGRWSHWDPKITTPPALYYFSWSIGRARALLDPGFELTTGELRFTNFISLYILLVALYVWKRVSKPHVGRHSNVFQRELAIVLFPLIFFFSGLYYTDLFSALSVVVTYTLWSASSQATGRTQVVYQFLHLIFGALSLLARQTNIFWVAIFLGGLQVLHTIKKASPGQLRDPPISEAFLEDFPTTAVSLLQRILNGDDDFIFQLFSDIWPSLSLLAAFAGFVLGNGGVVLGDKSNHVATIHLAQVLYFWAAVVFFSWPALLPSLVNLLSDAPNIVALRARLPRTATVLGFLFIFTLIVRFNTIVHPFILADNRHYTFYVFRILRQHPLVKYAAIPVYLVCGWLGIFALGRRPTSQGNASAEDGIRVGWVMVFLISTTLSLVTAPLVEPRYFLIPWLIWRMHLPDADDDSTEQESKKSSDKEATSPGIGATLVHLTQYSIVVELAWYAFINGVTCWMFLYRGFSWPQEPGKVQRFMW